MTTYLVRHASAGHRDDRDPHDDDRPLDDSGRVQAEKLAAWLRHLPITRILTSPFPRCVQTVEPLAAALGVPIETCDALAEGTPIECSWPLLESGTIAPVIDSVLPLAQAAEAHRRLESSAHVGKIILKVVG